MPDDTTRGSEIARPAFRRLFTIDVLWTGDAAMDWGGVIGEALSAGDPCCVYGIDEGQLRKLCEHAESEPDA